MRQIETQALRKIQAALAARGFTRAEWAEHLHTLGEPERAAF